MTLDDMQTLWQQHDVKLDDLLLDRARTKFARVTRNLSLESFVAAIAVVFLGGYAADHVQLPVIFAATVVLDIFALAVLISNVVPLAMLAGLDYDRPVLEIARAFDRVRLIRVRSTMWTLFIAPLIWPALFIVAMSALFGVDASSAYGATWLLANLAFGIVVLALGIVLARRYDARHTPSAPNPVFEALSGKSLRDASKQIAELERYATDAD